MRECFEIRDLDAGGRIGELTVPRAGVTVETPALLPVINPNLDTLSPRRMAEEFGAEILITNSYIIHSTDDIRERALENGLHEVLDFPGAIMTDSGSFQLSEYGEIDVTSEEILEFQHAIGSDIGTPVDIPTPPDVHRERAEDELATTQDRLERAQGVETGEMLVNAPVQGSTYPDLREEAGRHANATALDVFPVGAVVPLMNDYRYDDMVDAVAGAKRGLGADAPVHLFGAGHPMMFALGVAMGCDLFDSAAYALYARDDRYLTVRGTRHLEDLDYLPCSCPVCTEHSPDDLRALDDDARETELAAHNLHVTFEEIRRIKQAIRAGNLLELVEQRARAHPTMLDGYRALLDHAAQLEQSDPVSKGAFFYTSQESARRPKWCAISSVSSASRCRSRCSSRRANPPVATSSTTPGASNHRLARSRARSRKAIRSLLKCPTEPTELHSSRSRGGRPTCRGQPRHRHDARASWLARKCARVCSC